MTTDRFVSLSVMAVLAFSAAPAFAQEDGSVRENIGQAIAECREKSTQAERDTCFTELRDRFQHWRQNKRGNRFRRGLRNLENLPSDVQDKATECKNLGSDATREQRRECRKAVRDYVQTNHPELVEQMKENRQDRRGRGRRGFLKRNHENLPTDVQEKMAACEDSDDKRECMKEVKQYVKENHPDLKKEHRGQLRGRLKTFYDNADATIQAQIDQCREQNDGREQRECVRNIVRENRNS